MATSSENSVLRMLSHPWSLENNRYYYDLNVFFVPEIDGFLEREESIKNETTAKMDKL